MWSIKVIVCQMLWLVHERPCARAAASWNRDWFVIGRHGRACQKLEKYFERDTPGRGDTNLDWASVPTIPKYRFYDIAYHYIIVPNK